MTVMAADPVPILSETRRRTSSTTLSMLDEMLCDFEQRATDREHQSVLFRRTNTLTQSELDVTRTEAAKSQNLLEKIRDDLDLIGRGGDAASTIWSKAKVFRDSLCELEARRLKACGEVPAGLADYLDPKIHELHDRLTRVAEAAMGRSSVVDSTVAPRGVRPIREPRHD